ncbi:MAG: hypothetical protein CMK59_13325, partial [Proteobacteria bacterium]|nr:hypothetical protein [Pseudomonadota bacterium]
MVLALMLMFGGAAEAVQTCNLTDLAQSTASEADKIKKQAEEHELENQRLREEYEKAFAKAEKQLERDKRRKKAPEDAQVELEEPVYLPIPIPDPYLRIALLGETYMPSWLQKITSRKLMKAYDPNQAVPGSILTEIVSREQDCILHLGNMTASKKSWSSTIFGRYPLPVLPVVGPKEHKYSSDLKEWVNHFEGLSVDVGVGRYSGWYQKQWESYGIKYQLLVLDSHHEEILGLWDEQTRWLKEVIEEDRNLLIAMADLP